MFGGINLMIAFGYSTLGIINDCNQNLKSFTHLGKSYELQNGI